MNLTPLLADLNFMQGGIVIVAAVVIVIVVFLLLYMVFSRYTKVGPNQVLVVSGIKHRAEDGSKVGFRIVKGGGTFVYPILEKVDLLSLELCVCPKTHRKKTSSAPATASPPTKDSGALISAGLVR